MTKQTESTKPNRNEYMKAYRKKHKLQHAETQLRYWTKQVDILKAQASGNVGA